jgi:uncharacterized membrane protein
MDTIGGFAVANLLAIIIMILICFLAGFAARMALARSLTEVVEAQLHAIYPRYISALYRDQRHDTEFAGRVERGQTLGRIG